MKDAEHGDQEQRADKQDVPGQFTADQRCGGRAWRPAHGVVFRGFKGQGQPQRDPGHQVHPKNLYWRDRQTGADQQCHDDRQGFACIGGQRPANYLFDVVVDRAAFAHGGDDGREVLVHQHQFGRFLGGFAALLSHGNAHVGTP
ncbi:hypothetical protein D3C73_929650 [compost metagenome]